jgi:hypothetical protein
LQHVATSSRMSMYCNDSLPVQLAQPLWPSRQELLWWCSRHVPMDL